MESIKCGLIGSIVNIKGYDRIVSVLERNPKISLLVIGILWNPAAQATLDFLKDKEKKLKNLKVELKFLEESEFKIYANKVDILLFPYHIITASGMFCRISRYLRPTITWNLPYFKEIEDKYGACLTVNSIKELEETIIKVKRSPSLRKKLKEGMKKFNKDTSWENVAKKHIKVYESLL